MKNPDHAEKILYLTLVIRSLYRENNLPKDVIIEDFIYLMNEEEKDENH